MRKHLTLRNLAISTIGLSLLGLFATGAVRAITDTAFRYDPPRTGHYTVGSAALTPKGSNDALN